MRRPLMLVPFGFVVVVVFTGLNHAKGDSWGRAFAFSAIAAAIGVLVGVGYYWLRRVAKRKAEP